MSSNFQEALNIIRKTAKNEVEKGTAFEKLCKIFFENDDIQKQQFSKVWFYKDWAKENPNFSKIDIGIDLVAKLRNESGFCAIQSKCYNPEHSITKEDLDSFISASSNEIFSRLILIDTSTQELSANARSVIENLNKIYQRVQISELQQTRINWLIYIKEKRIVLENKKEPRDHQIKAVEEAQRYFKENDRGKMIMACGTGKTFTSLKIAEKLTGKGKYVLYMVPSLALMSQSIREWKNDSLNEFTAFSACSDKSVGKKKPSDDEIIVNLNELAFPATTDSKKLAEQIHETDKDKMTVIFSTYQSIDVISEAQSKYKLPSFDLIICDEAHRTTGATLTGDEGSESYFVKIHDDKFIKGKKRLYMTATPKIYGEKAKKKADEGQAVLASMDDIEIYGKTFFSRGFNWAVENNLLTDYKVVILAVDEERVSGNLQKSFEQGSELKLDDATKIIGVYKALAKVGFEKNDDKTSKPATPIKRALAFCQSIEVSKIFEQEFQNVIKEYTSNEKIEKKYKVNLEVEVKHIDGTFNADRRNERLNWLKENTEKNCCRILTNVKCLSEGIDVPTLDAIMFLHPRKSQIDIVQSVGRVMRKAEHKDIGYVIIPVTIAPGVSPEKALNDNERYRVVWQILNALRAHDERLESTINRIAIGEDVSDKIEIFSLDPELDAITSEIEDLKTKRKKKDKKDDSVVSLSNENNDLNNKDSNKDEQLQFQIADLSQAMKAKIVEKCGTRDYWENWASDIAKIAQTHVIRLNSLLVKKNSKERKVFDSFLLEIQDDLNPEISEVDAIEMLAQHIITKPVFDSLFSGNEFTKENAISKALEKVLKIIYEKNFEIENSSLENFYASVKRRAKDIVTFKGKQSLVLELYDRFFKNAFPRLQEKLGIVYTPVEIVDFINHSVNEILKLEFNKTLSEKNVNVLDPFAGTGTFISRLLQSDLIDKKDLPYKYKNELHANEIVLLAYYIAGINIESVYQDLVRENEYQPFNGIVLTDTFNLYEQERDMVANLLPDNSSKRKLQRSKKINVILGNPPYSAGQKSANDNAQNIKYLNLDKKIKETYVNSSSAVRKGAMYDSYIRAFRWATDRLEKDGIIAFVTNASWIDSVSADGLRKSFQDEFSKIYIFHLRGNQRTSGELSRKEGGKVFGSSSRTPVAITFLIKNSKNIDKEIFLYDIGDYLDTKQKLNIIKNFKSIKYLIDNKKFKKIIPDKSNDWVNKKVEGFDKFLKLGSKDKDNKELIIFKEYSGGLKTSRDSWCYNFSKKKLIDNVSKSIAFYNHEVKRYHNSDKTIKILDFVSKDSTKISWATAQLDGVEKNKIIDFNKNSIKKTIYRPFTKCWAYTDSKFINRLHQLPKIFPTSETENKIIVIPGLGSSKDFSTFILDKIPDLGFLSSCQCFPLKIFKINSIDKDLFDNEEDNDGITDQSLKSFQEKLSNKNITKENIFYYIYSVFHSEEYKSKFKNNLSKEMARIPISKNFKLFSEIGKKLADIHLNFDNTKQYEDAVIEYTNDKLRNKDPRSYYRVEKMFLKNKENASGKSYIIYNNNITIRNIPNEIFSYQINGKSALEWIIERQGIYEFKDSKITHDANDYANEELDNPKYPLELILKVITVSIETLKITKNLPTLDI
jgi:predicted helicase